MVEAKNNSNVTMLIIDRLLTRYSQNPERYIDSVYPNAKDYRIDTSQIYVVEVDWGRFNTGDISSNPLHWWKATRDGCIQIPLLEMTPFHEACEHGHKLWLSPIVSIYIETPRVLLLESFGPKTRTKHIITLSSDLVTPIVEKEEMIWKLDA